MRKIALFLSLLFLLISVAGCQSASPQVKQQPKTNTAQNSTGDLRIDKTQANSTVKFYPYTMEGIKLEVMAVKAGDGTVRTAFNTCQVCYNSGRGYYKQEGDQVVCQNCGNRFKIDQIEKMKNGCNPVPIMKEDKSETEKEFVIPSATIKEALPLFKQWKKA